MRNSIELVLCSDFSLKSTYKEDGTLRGFTGPTEQGSSSASEQFVKRNRTSSKIPTLTPGFFFLSNLHQ